MQLVIRYSRPFTQGRFSFSQMAAYKLPELKFGYSALEPIMSTTVLEFHHKKHHQVSIHLKFKGLR